jgi:FkbM family methyltransferase
MTRTLRKIAFVLAASSHGPLIVDRFDYHRAGDRLFGVGGEILEWSVFDPAEVELMLSLLRHRRRYFGDGVIAIDCGANIGVHTVECATEMTGWGSILAIEAQERLYYALAGNIALNNCFNARAVHAAVGARDGAIKIPVPNYLAPGSFGSLELRSRPDNEFIGQTIDYSPKAAQEIRCLKLDSLPLSRLDLIKIDVEGMELEVISGAAGLIARHRPILLVEWLKSDKPRLRAVIEDLGYRTIERGTNFLFVHPSDQNFAAVRDDFASRSHGEPIAE